VLELHSRPFGTSCNRRLRCSAHGIDIAGVSRYCQTNMKTVTLRTLMREPLKVKRMTRTGKPVQVTDNGQPLWIIQPATTQADKDLRRREIEEELAQVLRGPKSKIPLSRIVLESRR